MKWELKFHSVLILVLMEDALRESYKLRIPETGVVLILVLMEDALRELILRHAEFQSVTVPFSENPLDFRGKSVPNCPQIYEFSRLCLTLSERSHRADALDTMSSSTSLLLACR